MEEFSVLFGHVSRYIQLTSEEQEQFFRLLRLTRVRKRQYIVQPTFVNKYRSYVLKGAIRSYFVDNDGKDHTISFAVEDWWITDFNSYIFQQPATLFVEALEDCVLIQIDYNSEQLLMRTVPKFERFFRIVTERSFAFLQQRMLSNLSKTAQERYDEFFQKYPAIAGRVPQYALASYLGFSTEFLSRIRSSKVKTRHQKLT